MKALLLVIVALLTSCSMLNDACVQVVPVIAQGNTMINEAQDALMQAEAVIMVIKDDAQRTNGLKAVADARKTLRTAEAVLNSASDACQQPDLKSIFYSFATAWEIVRGFVSTMGGTGAGEVADPMAYSIGKIR